MPVSQLDAKYLEAMDDEIDDMISDIEQKIYGPAGQDFNIGSPAQLAGHLFDKLNLPKTGINKATPASAPPRPNSTNCAHTTRLSTSFRSGAMLLS